MSIRNSATAAIASLCLLAQPAKASIVTVSFTGIVTNSFDYSGEFGSTGGNNVYDGMTATARFIFDTSTLSANAPYIAGGGVYGGISPALSASFSVNGVTQYLAGASGNLNPPGLIVFFGPLGNSGSLSSDFHSAGVQKRVDSPYLLFYNQEISGLAGDGVYYAIYSYGIGPLATDADYRSARVYASNFTSFEVQSGIPEASTWVMAIIGALSLGLIAYQRQSAGPPAGRP